MQVDFHYYITYMAARAAGCDEENSNLMAEYAEAVDESFNRNDEAAVFRLLSKTTGAMKIDPLKDAKNKWVDGEWSPQKHISKGYCHRTAYGSFTKGATKKQQGRTAKAILPWMSFHFLPSLEDGGDYDFNMGGHDESFTEILGQKSKSFFGLKYDLLGNISYFKKRSSRRVGSKATKYGKVKERQERFKEKREEARRTGKTTKWQLKQRLICAPNSTGALNMVEDLLKVAGEYCDKGSLQKYLENPDINSPTEFRTKLDSFRKTLRARGDTIGFSSRRFLLALTGIRMHIYADTWAHQGFGGMRSASVNDVTEFLPMVGYANKREEKAWIPRINEKSKHWSGILTPHVRELSFFGHGRADSFPDNPAVTLNYRRPWDGKQITRCNPSQYADAYEAMVAVLQFLGEETGLASKKRQRAAFRPENLQAGFFGDQMPCKTDHGENKDLRCKFVWKRIRDQDNVKLIEFKDDPFAIIRNMYERSKRELAYFNLAAFYHQCWVEKQVLSTVAKGKYGSLDTFFKALFGEKGKEKQYLFD